MSINRLSSFLQKKGMLQPRHMTSVNKHVFYVETNHRERLILKRHHNHSRVEQQWNFFEQQSSYIPVPFQRFPNQKPFLYDNGMYWTISPYIPGQKLNYMAERDRVEALKSIQTFHNETEGIKLRYPLKKEIFYIRWYKRLQNFRNTESIFKEYGFLGLYKDMVQTAEKHLQYVSAYNWFELERAARKSGTWSHGDVASHNFIRYSGRIYLIDFDLLSCAPPLYDYIQLGQRFLPYLNWNAERLLSYKIVQNKYLKPWLHALFIPSDVMREWLYYIHSSPGRLMYGYLARMKEDWVKRQSFVKNAQNMLN
ncbi:Phosphotransferase enzyme family protein [Lentibacillus halodurans]|uniref:Phosphotransferase enzyme family protein n=2 Tax=Lentibacillus halodurans TaxID=237679 RepID=A0A1I0UYC9_9BACI|nr:Phosphotransferase enzyme family protein [Lentibacillus halodurans]